jgi:hypothetical protein
MALKPEDETALLQLIGLYTHTLDYGSVDEMHRIWTEDCIFVVDNPAMRIEGLAALKDMFRGTRAGYPQVRHVVSNLYIEQSGAGAILHSYLQVFDVDQMKVTMFARYRDRCVKTAQGWRIAERSCING